MKKPPVDPKKKKNHFTNKNFPSPDEQFTGKGFRDISGSGSPSTETTGNIITSDILDKDLKEKKNGNNM